MILNCYLPNQINPDTAMIANAEAIRNNLVKCLGS
jgi:hypothetical protein